jgi:DNA modification methylase
MTKINLKTGDALVELKKINDSSVDLIIADPPYNLKKDYGNNKDNKEFEEYINFTKKWLQESKRILKKNGTIYIFMGVRFISYLFQILEKDLNLIYNSWITWHYTQGMGKTKGFSPRHDDILAFNKSDNFNFNLDDIRIPQKFYRQRNNMRGANPGDVWEFSHVHYSNPNRQKHPTQKPEGLIERLVLASSNESSLVLDPFFGSGTTARVCQQLNRNFIGIELNPKYKKMTEERLKKKFDGFDSVDPRVKRIPNDLRKENIRNDYIKKHIKYFLQNHNNTFKEFKDNVKLKYKIDIDDKGNILQPKQKKLF